MKENSFEKQKKELDKIYRQTLIIIYSYKAKITNHIKEYTPQDDMEILLKYDSASVHNLFTIIHESPTQGILCKLNLDTNRTFILPILGKYRGSIFTVAQLKISPEQFITTQVMYTKYKRELATILHNIRNPNA